MSRKRIAVGAAALALIGASVFGGALSASAGPIDAPVITFPGSGPSNDAQPTIVGSVTEDGLTVVVQVTNTINGTMTYCTDTTATIAGGFSCPGIGPLPSYETHHFTAYAFYTSGTPDALNSPTSPVVDYEVYGTEPVDFTTSPAAITADDTPTFSGDGPALGTVDVREGIAILCTAAVDASHHWTCDSSPLAPGLHTGINARGIDMGSGVTNDTAPDFTYTPVPTPSVDQTFSPWITSSDKRSIQGTKDAAVNYVQVYVSPDGVSNWTPYCQTNSGLAGSTVWFCQDPPFGTLLTGTNYVAAVGFDVDSNSSTGWGVPATIERVAQPIIDTPADGIFTNDSTPTVTGTSVSGATMTVYNSDDASQMCSTPIAAGAFACDSVPTADGTYNYFAYATPGDSLATDSRTITIDTVAPGFPAITAPGVIVGPVRQATSTDPAPLISGTGEPHATVTVRADGLTIECAGGNPVVTLGGTWSCAPVADLALGSHSITTAQADRATNSSGVSPTQLELAIIAAPIAVAVPPAPVPVPTPTPSPAPPKVPLVWTLHVAGDSFEPGDETDLWGTGLPSGAAVEAELHSTPIAVGSTLVDADGSFRLHVTIPLDIEPGAHHFVVLVTPAGEPAAMASQAVTVVPAKKAVASPPAKPDPAATGDDGSGGSTGTDRDNPGAPSSLTHAIDTFQQIITNPIVLGTAAAAGLGLLLFVAFPAELLNSTLSEQYGRIQRLLPPAKAPWFRRFRHWLETTPLFGGILITFLAAVIFGFADPNFGFDVTSARVVLACFIALFIVGYVASAVAGLIIRRRWNLPTVMELKPLGIVLTVVGVVISRLLDFSPGFLIGLILGVALSGKTTVPERAKASLVQSAVIFAFAILGWVGYSVLSGVVDSGTFGGALLFDTLVAITTEGLTALFVGLLPFRFLEGESIFAQSKVVWMVTYVIAAFGFLAIVVPSANTWGEVGISLPLWIGIVGGFFVLAVGIYLYFRFWAKPLDETDGDDEPAPERVTSGNDAA